MSDLPYPPPYQDLATLAQHICVSESSIENWVNLGQFPKPKKIGPSGKRLWSWKEVCRHLDGPQDIGTMDLIGRITNATREAALRKDHVGGIRKRGPGVPDLAQVPEPRGLSQDSLPASADAG